MSQEVALFFLRPWLGAGSTTFTAHLYRAFEAIGWRPTVYRVADFETPGVQQFGAYGQRLQCVNMHTAMRLVRDQPAVITALARSPHVRADVVNRLVGAGAMPVLHDSNEVVVHAASLTLRCVCVRQATLKLVPRGQFVPHPYVRQAPATSADRGRTCSLARVAVTKRTDIVLDANRLRTHRIDIIGMEDGPYAAQLRRRYPEMRAARAPFPFSFDAPVRALAPYAFNVDMSYFSEDGGGTQYAQLEAMDAGVVNVMHADWFRYGGELTRAHAWAVAGAPDLASLERDCGEDSRQAIAGACGALLRQHDPEVVGAQYREILKRE